MLEDELKTKEFEVLGKLANQNKVRLLDRPNNLSQLKNACQLINQDIAI